ncbi:Uncharacterised protein [Mycobacteroides abscessus subsp. abscessus]|nr:Uncharacterised protein [Mycobacteroides abscessus subsp. abscessus]
MYQAWLGPMAVRILVASNTPASVWLTNTTVRTTKPAASSGSTSGQVPTSRRRFTRMRRIGRPPASRAATAIRPVGWMPRVNAALMMASAAGVSRLVPMARSMRT